MARSWHSIYQLEHHPPELIEGEALEAALENMPVE
jgi:hypothetical protein